MHKKYQSPLSRLQPDKIDSEKIKKQGWKENQILVVNVNDERLTWPEEEVIKQIGNRIYNKKNQESLQFIFFLIYSQDKFFNY